MSRVECLPGDNMYGNTTRSVAPASTQASTPCGIKGSASSMCAARTMTSGPTIDCNRLATQSSMWLASDLTEPWSMRRMARIGSAHPHEIVRRRRQSGKHLQRQLHLTERRGYLHALNDRPHPLQHLASDRDPLGRRVLLRLLACFPHPDNDALRYGDSRDLIRQELCVPQ